MALKILLADDSMTAQNMGKKILVDAGYDVIAVSNGAAAIKKIASDRPDIVILDVYMPGYSGDEVCERVKGSPETAQIPVLLTVGKMEPFNPEKANKAKADGVMIKPFEATDLLAAVQAMAARKPVAAPHIPTQKIETPAHEKTLRIPPPIVSLVDTFRIPPPAGTPEPSSKSFDDTLPVAPPTVDHDQTVRLTADQIRAFQDASYKEWMIANEPAGMAPAASPRPEHDDTILIAPPIHQEAAPEVAPLEMPVEPPLAHEEAETAAAIPVFSASSMEHPAATFEHEPPEMQVTAVYQPRVPGHEEPASPPPFFGVMEPEPEAVNVPTVPTVESAPVVDYTPAALLEPTPVFVEPEAVSEAPVLETNAPAAPEAAFVAPLEELETLQPTVHEVIAPPDTPDLEINSPIHLQEQVSVSADPALVTNQDDMSEFTTHFGVEKPEEISVGVISELTPEQIATVTAPNGEAPAFEPPAPPQIEEPVISLVSEMPVEEAAPAAEAVGGNVEEVTFVPELGTSSRTAEGDVQEQSAIEVLEPRPDLEGPTTDDSLHRYEAEVQLVAEPEAEEAHEIVEPQPERVFVRMDFQPDEDAHEIIEPEVVPAPELVEPAQVEAIAAVPQVEQSVTQAVTPAVEASAAAAAAAAAVGIGAAYVAHEFPVHDEERVSVSVEAPAVEEHAVEEQPAAVVSDVAPPPEPIGDAELAEQLAAALAHSEAEQRARAAAETVATSAVEPAVAAAVEPIAAMGEAQGWTDAKLAEAISRAIEHLKPQLIQEIVTELMKK